MEGREILVGTVNFGVTEKVTQNKLLFLTRKKKKNRISLEWPEKEQAVCSLFPRRRKDKFSNLVG